jgi:hypothetical protein
MTWLQEIVEKYNSGVYFYKIYMAPFGCADKPAENIVS